MKANELMIGDWVQEVLYLHGGNNQPSIQNIQIKNIYGHEINCEVEDYQIISGIHVNDCKPIPLTHEILEKNGFVFDHDVFDGIYPMVNIIYCDYKLLVDDGKCIDCGENNIIHYVHELQHALRLCGLNELADNFKI